MLKKSIYLFLSVFVTFAASTSITHAEDDPKVVRISVVAYNIAGKTTYMDQEALTEQGGLVDALAKRGVKVEWVPAATAAVGPIINEGFANGSIDFASYGDLPPIILNSAQPVSQLIVPWGRKNNTYLVVPANSSAKSILDLKGKRIALHRGRPWEIAFANLVESQGLTLKDFKIVNVNPQVGAAALASGSVDAFVSLTDAYNLVDKKVGKIIWSTKNSPADWKLFGGLWGSNDFVQKYPELTQIIANSYVKLNYWTSQDKNREQYIKQYASIVQPESVIRRDYDDDSVSWKDRWSPLYDQALTEHYRRSVTYARESGLIQNDIDLGKLLNPRFVNQAIKDLKIDNYWINTAFQAKN